jgi:hypothetical protein
MNSIEETFVRTFISRDRRDRWLTLLPDTDGRKKLLRKLPHVLLNDLDLRWVFDKDNLPDEIARQIGHLRKQWEQTNPEQWCHIICHTKMDGLKMKLPEAEADYGLTYGAVIILIPDRLAYYHTERSNINKQPFYALFRP